MSAFAVSEPTGSAEDTLDTTPPPLLSETPQITGTSAVTSAPVLASSSLKLDYGTPSRGHEKSTNNYIPLGGFKLPGDFLSRLSHTECNCFPDWASNIQYYCTPTSDNHPGNITRAGRAPFAETATLRMIADCGTHERYGRRAGNDRVRGLLKHVAKVALPAMIQQNESLQEEAGELRMFTWQNNYKWEGVDFCHEKRIWTILVAPNAKEDEAVTQKGFEGLLNIDQNHIDLVEGEELAKMAEAAMDYFMDLEQRNGDLWNAIENSRRRHLGQGNTMTLGSPSSSELSSVPEDLEM